MQVMTRRVTSSVGEEAHLPAAASAGATPRIVAPPNTAVHSLANSEANSPRIMAEPPPGLRLPLAELAPPDDALRGAPILTAACFTCCPHSGTAAQHPRSTCGAVNELDPKGPWIATTFPEVAI